MNKKGQAAMEFLMTYGWAIVVVLAAIGALAYFGVLSPNKLLPDRTTFSAPLPNVDNAVIDFAGNTVAIAFRNNKGVAIEVPQTGTFTSTQCDVAAPPGITGVIDSVTRAAIAPADDIQNGAGFIVTWSCTPIGGAAIGSKFKADVTIDYVNTETGQTLKQTGTIEGKFG
jgi:hypothetical protein